VVEAGRYLTAGLTWALSTLFFLFVGSWLDGRLGTEPVLTVVGAFVGGGAGLYWMIRHLSVKSGGARGSPRDGVR
jgi:positive regulator of sigma E activity